MPIYDWKFKSVSIFIEDHEKVYGVVNRKDGSSYMRKYRKPIKNGLSLADVIERKWKAYMNTIIKDIKEKVYASL